MHTSFNQLWSHVHRQRFHAKVDTDNYVEAFNGALKHQYLCMMPDRSVYALDKVLLQSVFPDQETQYHMSVAKQIEKYCNQGRTSQTIYVTNQRLCKWHAC